MRGLLQRLDDRVSHNPDARSPQRLREWSPQRLGDALLQIQKKKQLSQGRNLCYNSVCHERP